MNPVKVLERLRLSPENSLDEADSRAETSHQGHQVFWRGGGLFVSVHSGVAGGGPLSLMGASIPQRVLSRHLWAICYASVLVIFLHNSRRFRERGQDLHDSIVI